MKLHIALFLIFLTLKLAGEIAWSWVWVFAPIWIHALVAIGFGFLIGFNKTYARAKPSNSTPAQVGPDGKKAH